MDEFIYKEEGYRIIGCFYAVYNTLGPGFLEAVYQEALEKEFIKAAIPYVREKKIDVYYSEEKLKKYYKADFLCYLDIVIELKAKKFLPQADNEQLINSLKGTNCKVGYLVNFGGEKIFFKRFINTNKEHR